MENKAKPHAEHLTIMMLDLCSYTHISSKINRQTLHELHDLFDSLSIPTIQEYHGLIVNKIGDAFLATFKSPTNALHCSIALQNKFKEYNKINLPRYPLKIKIALHSGEVIIKDKDVYGDPVNIASRIESIAKAGDILFSRSVFAAMNTNEIPSKYLGIKQFKGVKYPVKIHRVLPKKIIKKSGNINIFWKIIIWILIIGAAYFFLRYFL
ncbi:MAG: adenylate/guanylate cyclase domain-containing protein [archaeon]|nr:adenylate/guanylate cyclase domain-containing protein [archaeon]